MVFLDDFRAAIGLTLVTLGIAPIPLILMNLKKPRINLLKIVPNIKLFDSDSPKTALIAGDVDLGMTWTGEAFIANQENPDIQYIYPEEGPILWQDNWVMLKYAVNVDAAYAWTSYTMHRVMFSG